MKKERIVYFDILNILAAISVIFLHCNGSSFTFSNTLGWVQSMLIESVCYWAVPIFLMLSGANLMGYREKYTTKTYFSKRFFRTVIPFIVWSLIVAVEKRINPFNIGFRNFIGKLFGCSIENVYWFFIPLFAVYLSIPVISLLKDNRKILWYMAGGAFLLHSLLPHVLSCFDIPYNNNLSMQTVGGMLIFPIVGYLLATTNFTKLQRSIIYTLAIFSCILRFFGTYFLSLADGKLNKTFYGYIEYWSVLLACGVFVFFKQSRLISRISKNIKVCKILTTLSSCSFGVYLIHMIVFRFLGRFFTVYSWEWRLLIPFLIYIISLSLTFLFKKIPVLKLLVP